MVKASGKKKLHLRTLNNGCKETCCGEINMDGIYEMDMTTIADDCNCDRCKKTLKYKMIKERQKEPAAKKPKKKKKRKLLRRRKLLRKRNRIGNIVATINQRKT